MESKKESVKILINVEQTPADQQKVKIVQLAPQTGIAQIGYQKLVLKMKLKPEYAQTKITVEQIPENPQNLKLVNTNQVLG